MGIRYRKRVKILPGLYINISKSGISTTVGPRGASVNFGRNGTYLNTGIPGSGLYSRDRISGPKRKITSQNIRTTSVSYSNSSYNTSNRSRGNANHISNGNSITHSRKGNNHRFNYKLILKSLALTALIVFFFAYNSKGSFADYFSSTNFIITSIITFAVIYIVFLLVDYKKRNDSFNSDVLDEYIKTIKAKEKQQDVAPSLSPSSSSGLPSKNRGSLFFNIDISSLDPLYAEAARIVVANNIASTSFLQRKLSLGYNRAGRIMDQLESTFIVGPQIGDNPRDILIKDLSSLDNLLSSIELIKLGVNVPIDDEVISLFRKDVFSVSSYSDEKESSDDSTSKLQNDNLLLGAINNVLSVKTSYTFDINSFFVPPVSYIDKMEQLNLSEKVKNSLKSFGINITSIRSTVGPRITLIEITIEEGQPLSSVMELEADLSVSIGYDVSRIYPIFDKGTIGIEVCNRVFKPIGIVQTLATGKKPSLCLPCVIGVNSNNFPFVFDLKELPHLLVAGSTGQGKTNVLHSVILSLISYMNPTDLKLLLFDSKGLEFGKYNMVGSQFLAGMHGMPSVISTIGDAEYALNSLRQELELRQDLLHKAMASNIRQYNTAFMSKKLNPSDGHKYLPYLVLVIDDYEEFKNNSSMIEEKLVSIARDALSAGIHIVMSTKRPTADIISTTLKAIFNSRIALHLLELSDSMVVLDKAGAEKLYGDGDMLFLRNNELQRCQCALVETDDIKKITNSISNQVSYPYYLPIPSAYTD